MDVHLFFRMFIGTDRQTKFLLCVLMDILPFKSAAQEAALANPVKLEAENFFRNVQCRSARDFDRLSAKDQ